MISPDVNVLVYAHRSEMPDHDRYRNWVENVVTSGDEFALSELALSGFIRVVTNARVFPRPTPLADALNFTQRFRSADVARVVAPGPNHWTIFVDLCRVSGAAGNLVPDAYFAALAIEHDLEWITTDRDYARFPGLRYRHPLGVAL